MVSCEAIGAPVERRNVMNLYNWRHGIRDGNDLDPGNLREVEPIWAAEATDFTHFSWETCLRFPSFKPDGEVYLVARCATGIRGLRILPQLSSELKESDPLVVSCESLREDVTSGVDRSEITLFNRTISLQKRESYHHQWQDGGFVTRRTPPRVSRIDIRDSDFLRKDSFAFRTTKPIYDPYAHRAIILAGGTSLCVLDMLVP
jgi:hypothetical protein